MKSSANLNHLPSNTIVYELWYLMSRYKEQKFSPHTSSLVNSSSKSSMKLVIPRSICSNYENTFERSAKDSPYTVIIKIMKKQFQKYIRNDNVFWLFGSAILFNYQISYFFRENVLCDLYPCIRSFLTPFFLAFLECISSAL
jgi:hypothetical protein